MKMVNIRLALPDDINECIKIRGMTRENPVSSARLAELGITVESWSMAVKKGDNIGFIALFANKSIGFCFGDTKTGEILVLAILPEFENRGVGKALLGQTMRALQTIGHKRLFLGSDPRPHIRAYGFYRHLGWKPSGAYDKLGDEELVYIFEDSTNI